MKSLNRHTDDDRPTKTFGNFINVEAPQSQNKVHATDLKNKLADPQPALIKIPAAILQTLPKTFQQQMIMGPQKVDELIGFLRASVSVDAYSSVLFRLMAAQSDQGRKMIIQAAYHKNQVQENPVATDVSAMDNISGFSHQTLNILTDFEQLYGELRRLNDQRALIKDVGESFIFLALRKSIICDMCVKLKQKYEMLAKAPDIPESKKIALHTSWQELYIQFTQINLPQGFQMVPFNKRKPLAEYLAEYRDYVRLSHNKAQNHVQSTVPSQAIKNQSINLAQNNSAKMDVVKQPGNLGTQVTDPKISMSIPLSESLKSSSILKKDNVKLSSRADTLVDHDSLNLPLSKTPSMSSSKTYDVGVTSESIGKKGNIVIVDDDSDERDDHIRQNTTVAPAQKNEPVSAQKEKSEIFDLTENGDTDEPPTNITDLSNYTDDGSFISSIRYLNKSSSPSSSKKRKASENMAEKHEAETKFDLKWQEGFTQGLFFNFGMDSPFGEYEQSNIDQTYLEGFKAASSYYTLKVRERESN